jgi:hypothetical protein
MYILSSRGVAFLIQANNDLKDGYLTPAQFELEALTIYQHCSILIDFC